MLIIFEEHAFEIYINHVIVILKIRFKVQRKNKININCYIIFGLKVSQYFTVRAGNQNIKAVDNVQNRY